MSHLFISLRLFSATLCYKCLISFLKGLILEGLILKGLILEGLIHKGLILKGLILEGLIFKGLILKGPILEGLILKGLILEGLILKGSIPHCLEKQTTQCYWFKSFEFVIVLMFSTLKVGWCKHLVDMIHYHVWKNIF